MNKKTVVLIMAAIMLLFGFGCKLRAKEIAYVPVKTEGYGYSDATEYPVVSIINSKEGLNVYLEAYDYIYPDDTIGFEALRTAAENYDEIYFEEHALISVLLERNSGSISFTINSITKEGSTVTIDITRNVPEMGTQEMALTQYLFEVSKDDISSDDKVEVVFSK